MKAVSLEALESFVGRWHAEAEAPGTDRRFSLTYEVQPALGGVWLMGSGSVPELGTEIRDFWGIDPVSGEIVRVIFDSQHNYGTVRSAGWEGDTLRLEGEVRGAQGVVVVRETITRRGADEFTAVWEAKLESGWSAYSVEHLTRQPVDSEPPTVTPRV